MCGDFLGAWPCQSPGGEGMEEARGGGGSRGLGGLAYTSSVQWGHRGIRTFPMNQWQMPPRAASWAILAKAVMEEAR